MSIKKAVIVCTSIVVTILALFGISFIIIRSPAKAEKADRYGILSLLPPLVAIVLAFITKATVLSLFIGVFIGEFMVNVTNLNIAGSFVNGFLSLGSQVISSMADQWNAGIILQCLLIGGVIQLIAKMGGAKALAESLAKRANTPRKAQLITEFLGLLVFFDDYANSLIVGPIMRPIMDKLRVSREKLAFLVDATAAPVAGIAIVSTWIGLEVSLIADGFKSIGKSDVTGFDIFLQTIPFRFYNILILIFVAMTAITLIEFGPMKKAEQKARKREDDQPVESLTNNKDFEEVQPVKGAKLSIWNAIIPILTLVLGALVAFYWSGYTTIMAGEDKELINLMSNSSYSLRNIFKRILEALSQADASVALFQSALLASIVAIVMAAAQNILSIEDAIGEWINGMKTIVITGVILLLAWSLGGVIKELGTADYLVGILKNAIPKFILPTLIFVLSAIISFATGTSYGTMSILMPLTIPLAWAVHANMDFAIVCTSGVLTGAIFGDHCSPISDTTILSSMGTSCNHIAHVQTQIYYTIYVALITIFICYIPAGFGISWYITIPVAIIVMYIGLRLLGEKIPFNSDVIVEVPEEIKIETPGSPKEKEDEVKEKETEVKEE
ncbi:Na+/H+ antiporter protein [Neocallimastix lanati (nom. inval.)]|jgi:Na+/H+ antiporter NhaC|uniref:Na+/H+ antiporter protein n=1 Tax=Neocallimastix californiae TaxID=1754190 RepID=A0A1Y2FML8_9FUNG|nr:Na+/H+ antiporter protein [Neocallimastix sp. JGI-2020a]ORY83985.1 Na+/H+ antiporter protein [Neocallimastix californiae]|eukprot:ORY83985.1 Na+/H+ antiporter protein [Neocallimastix californiae]